jgi:hypothetical protein
MVKRGHGSRGAGDFTGIEGEAKESEMRNEAPGDAGPRAKIDPRVQTEIGKHLRAIYDDVINEPVPSKFMELLEKLEQSTTRKV